MGQIDDLFEEAADEVREELEGKVLDLCKTPYKLLSLRVSPEDKKRIKELISAVKAADSANARKKAFQAFSKSATEAGWRLVKTAAKAMIVLAMALFLWRPAAAQPGPEAAAPTLPTIEDASTIESVKDIVAPPVEEVGLLEFLQRQRVNMGVSISPFNVKDLDAMLLAYWKGPQIGERGLTIIPGLHKPEAKPYLDLDVGGAYIMGLANEKIDIKLERIDVVLNLHILNMTEWVMGKLPFRSRIRMPQIPDALVGGPHFRLPLPGEDLPVTWKNNFRLLLGWEFGGGKKEEAKP